MTLGIIGTAGRGPDGEAFKNNPAYWRMMKVIAQIVVAVLQPDRLVSGGAAFSDHLAVQLFLEEDVPNLTLHLPAEWSGHGFKETSSKFDTGRTSNWYHSLFSRDVGIDSLGEIQRAIEKGASIRTGAGGFKERNSDIAKEADVLLAFTFGNGAELKDGGTKNTWDKFLARRPHWNSPAYHFDLTTKKLYANLVHQVDVDYLEYLSDCANEDRMVAEMEGKLNEQKPKPVVSRTEEEERLGLL